MTAPPLSPLYVAARRVLLDATEALDAHRRSVILAGAQAIYLRVGDAELDASVAPFTTDADLTLDPRELGPDPDLSAAMRGAGFERHPREPGIWTASISVDGEIRQIPVDLLVPETLAGKGSRSADLPDHEKNSARRTPGLEAVVVDHDELTIVSLEPDIDSREATIQVAGVTALLVAKAHKLNDRVADAAKDRDHRLKPKDAGDVLRLMRGSNPARIGRRLRALSADPMAGTSVKEGVDHLRRLFGRRRSPGVEQAVQALAGALPEDTVRNLAVGYTDALGSSYDAS